jgi:RND family efflux transporter MFP subunit
MTMAIETPATPQGTSPSTLRSASARERLSTLFPDSNAPTPPWWRRRRREIAVAIVVVLIASSVLAARAFAADSSSYRTAVVANHDVDELLNGVATIEPVSQSSVAFPAAGTVAAVNVKLGDTVTVGQTLASLDPVELNQALHEKQAQLAQAELALEQALSGQTPSQSDGGGTNPVALSATTPTSPALAAAQQAVLAAQRTVDEALHTASNALDAAATVCATAGVGSSAPSTPTADALTACQTATNDVLTAQTAVNDAQQKLAAAAKTLDDLIAQQAANPSGSDGSTRAPANDAPANDAPAASSNGSSRSNSPATSSPSSADLVGYQKAVDAAGSEVAVAQQAIAQATIVSPIAGTVEAVNFGVGDSVDAASTTANVVVVGAGGFEATTLVSVDDISDVKVGQKTTVLPDGSKQPLPGTVSSISLVPDPAASTTSYRVVIGLTDRASTLNNGSTGSVAIVTESSRAGLAVPSSAVTALGNRHTVTVLDGATTKLVAVEVGVVGETWTEITSGLTAGQQVVLADISEPLPGSATKSSGTDSQLPNGLKLPVGGPTGGFNRGGPVGR